MAFPNTILDLKTELLISGTWTDISSKVRSADGVTITRGRPDESSQTSPSASQFILDNSTGDFSPRNPSGAYYTSIGRNTALRHSLPEGQSYLRLEDDAAASYSSCPDSAGISITGDTEIQLDLTLHNWRAGTALAAHWATSGNQRAWALQLDAAGTLTFSWSTAGTAATVHTATSTAVVAVPALRRQAIKVTFDVNNGASGNTVTFYTAPTISGSWTQLGDPVITAGTTSVFDSTARLTVGYDADLGLSGVQGKIHAFKLLSGIGGTVKASPDFTAATAGASSLTDAQSNVWTLSGTAEFSNRKYRFHGEVATWPQAWDLSGKDVTVAATASGILRRLSQSAAPLSSALYRGIARLTGSLAPVAYWPCEDGENAGQAASAIGGPAMTASSGVRFAAESGYLSSNPVVQLNNGSLVGRVPTYTGGTVNALRFLMHVPAAGTTDQAVIARMYTSGTIHRFQVRYGTGGTVAMEGYDIDGVQLFNSGAVAFAVNGKLLRVELLLEPNGSSVDWHFDTIEAGAGFTLGWSGTQASASIGNTNKIWIGKDALGDTGIGHVSVQKTADGLFDLIDEFNAWTGETAGNRFIRLCGEEGISYRTRGNLDNSVKMGAQLSKQLTDLLTECADADGGMLYEPREILGLGYRTSGDLCSQSAAVTLAYDGEDIAGDDFQPVDDDQRTQNDVTITRSSGGSSSRQVLSSGTLSVNAPPDGVGRYDITSELSLHHDTQLDDASYWRLHIGTVDEPRFPQIPVNLARSEVSDVFYDCQDVEAGDRIVITGMPAWLPDDLSQIAEGFTENLGAKSHIITWACAPASPLRVPVADGDFWVDTAGSVLHSSATSGTTSLSVDTTSGPLWTTDSGDMPFDIFVGGERMTVTAISGTSGTQTFTVTRAVNGVVKAHSAGDAVALAEPAYVGLAE